MRSLDEEQIEAWMVIVRRHLRKYRGHREYDDILASGYFGMWKVLRSARWQQVKDEGTALVLWGVNHEVSNFLWGSACLSRQHNVRGNPVLAAVSITEIDRKNEDGRYWGPIEPDFVPALLERLQAERELAAMKPRRRAALLLGCLYGLSRKEIARQLGVPYRQIKRDLQGVWVVRWDKVETTAP